MRARARVVELRRGHGSHQRHAVTTDTEMEMRGPEGEKVRPMNDTAPSRVREFSLCLSPILEIFS